MKIDNFLFMLVAGFATLVATLYVVDVQLVFDPKYLLPVLNTVFLSMIPGAASFTAAKLFLSIGSAHLLILGSSMLSLSLGGLIGGWFVSGTSGPNSGVTIYNSSILIFSILLTVGKLRMSSAPEKKIDSPRVRYLLISYLTIFILVLAIVFAALFDITTPFILQGHGQTALGKSVILAAIILLAFTGTLFFKEYIVSGASLFRWCTAGLALLTIGLAGILLQKFVGSPLGWAARMSQYAGTICFLVGIVSLWKAKMNSGQSLEASLQSMTVKRISELEKLNVQLNESLLEQRKVEDNLHISQERYRDLVEKSECLITSVNQEGRFLFVNGIGEKIYGKKNEELIGEAAFDFIYYDDIEKTVSWFNDCISKGLHQSTIENRQVNKISGATFYMHWSCKFYYDKEGKLITIGSIAHDITEQKVLEDELRKAKIDAEAANVAKGLFLSKMSHEIRTPMNGILGMAQLLQMPDLNEVQRQNYSKVILNSGESLLNVIDDILDLAKVESGKIVLESIAFSPEQLLEEMKTLFTSAANKKSLQINVKWFGPADQQYLGDPHRLRQMLSNLISNALKFTMKGGVTVEAREVGRKGKNAILSFSVIDTGIGISRDQFSSIFEPFSQADTSISRQFGGTGLGLSIVRGLARTMGGDIEVKSSPGQGACFSFKISMKSIDTGKNLQTSATRANIYQQKMSGRVLVVDDDSVNRSVISMMLDNFGLSVVAVDNGQEAIDTVKSGEIYDLVLMDLQMPGMGGCLATQLIRQWEKENHRPRCVIVALTAAAFEEDYKKCYSAGMDDVLTKPIMLPALFESLNRWIEKRASD